MVDAVVSYVVQRLGDFLIEEAIDFFGGRKQVQLLKNELEWMQCFIKDAEEKQVEDAMIRKWVSEITDIAYDTEDVLDKFMLKIHEEGTPRRRSGTFFVPFKSVNRFVKVKMNSYSIGKEIKELRKRISDLSRKRELYHLEDLGNAREGKLRAMGRLKQLRRATSFTVEENIVGFNDDADKLMAKLLEKEPRRFVISIIGMGGLGKTTLARKLYHNIDVINNFHLRAWVSVSQDYRTRDLLLRIIESFKIKTIKQMKEIGRMDEEYLERDLHTSLQGCSYLLVMDDVWQKETWESLKRAFPDNKNGSRVIITTRIREVAERSDEKTYVHEHRFLRPDESWQLFCEKAFQNLNSVANEGMIQMGREMVEKCGGLPLAVVVLGGLLSTKKPQEWSIVHNHVWQYLTNDSIQVAYLLALSFNDLPYQLKLCFLYMGLFPEDFEISIRKLTRLLVAEGFVLGDEFQIIEEVAENYLNQLINRSLIQVGKRCWGRVTTCRVHDLLRNLAIEKAKELNFVHICDEVKHSRTLSSITTCRRLAVYSESERFFWFQHCNPLSRSLFFFKQPCDLRPLCSRFRLLRVLEVEVSASNLPKEIGKLIHLIYLGLKTRRSFNLSPFITQLKRLQTLELNSLDGYITLPTEILKLQELRHLIGFFTGPLPIADLKNLLTLKYACFASWAKINPEKLINLRELQIEEGGAREKVFSLDSIAKLRSLRILSVWFGPDQSFTSLRPLGHCPCLVDLRLNGKLEELPRDLDQLLPNLEVLKIQNSFLKDDPMPSLEKFPNLMVLVLSFNSYRGKKMMCRANGFPRLEILQLLGLDHLEVWEVDEDAMPLLRGLEIVNSNLTIPERLRSIPVPYRWECKNRLVINKSNYSEF